MVVTESERRLIDIRELSQLLRLNPSTIYSWIYEGTCPIAVIRVRRQVRFDLRDVETYIERSKQEGAALKKN